MIKIREAFVSDLPFLIELEKVSFIPERQAKEMALKRSLSSKFQRVFIIEMQRSKAGAAAVFVYKNTYRLYSLAIYKDYRNLSLGKTLLTHVIHEAKNESKKAVTLEVDGTAIKLIHFYESFGFVFDKALINYYGEGTLAHRMVLSFEEIKKQADKPINLVVIDQDLPWLYKLDNIEVMDAETFLQSETSPNKQGFRVFNLCASYEYQTLGYYVSLLATARNQKVIPNVTTIKDFTDSMIVESIGEEINELVERSLKHLNNNIFTLKVIFGQATVIKYQRLARALHTLFEAPLVEFVFVRTKYWHLQNVRSLPFSDINDNTSVQEAAHAYFSQKRFSARRFKDYRYDLAILIDYEEKTPPSDKIALSKFKLAAEKFGFYTEFITKDDYHRIPEFDALFIRTTTNVNDYTYRFSRFAYAEGLALIDDPWTILKCSNKLFLQESMKKIGISMPESVVISKNTALETVLEKLEFPVVLKQPDSAFSQGVYKVHTLDELTSVVDDLLKHSELIIAQAFIKSAFDWRIGVLDNKPIYACKYYMAKNHWQIYNWQSRHRKNVTGGVEAVSLKNVPKAIIKIALKAANAMGDGFYGVDLKETESMVYVIEVNDNPSIDYRWEDLSEGDLLYEKIIKTGFERIEAARNVKRKII